MASHTVEKIGGTSIAHTQAALENVLIAGRTGKDLYGRIFVVSAYAGMTDKLLKHKKSGAPGVFALFAGGDGESSWREALDEVGAAMRAVNADIFDKPRLLALADAFVDERVRDVRSCLVDLDRLCSYGHFSLAEHLLTVREMLAALGEAHSAHNTAMLLRDHGVDARFVDLTGWRDDAVPTLDERISSAFADVDLATELPIATGYARCREGMLRTFDRGYTEATFSRIAVLTRAREAIIHKEFHLSSADPKLVGVDRVRKIGRTNYDVADQLANMGMEAIHPRAAQGLRRADIPLRVKNTFDPDDEGTVFSANYVSRKPQAEIVTGIAGVIALELFEQDMVGVKGYDAAILQSLTRHKIRIVTKCSNANTIAHYVVAPLKRVKRAVADLIDRFPGARVTTERVSIISVIGSDLALPRLTARAVSALADADIEVLGLHQLLRNVDLQFVIKEDGLEAAVTALHAALIEEPAAAKISEAA